MSCLKMAHACLSMATAMQLGSFGQKCVERPLPSGRRLADHAVALTGFVDSPPHGFLAFSGMGKHDSTLQTYTVH